MVAKRLFSTENPPRRRGSNAWTLLNEHHHPPVMTIERLDDVYPSIHGPIATTEWRVGSDLITVVVGGITERRESMFELGPYIAEHVGADVVIADQYGQGGSGGRWNLSEMIVGHGGLIHDLAKGYEATAMVGYSAGGIIGAHVSLEQRLAGIVFINTPAAAQDLVPLPFKPLLAHPRLVPRRVFKAALNAYDRAQRKSNERYRELSAVEIDRAREQDPDHLQFAGLRVGDPYELIEGIRDAPRVDAIADLNETPALFMWGASANWSLVRPWGLSRPLRKFYDRWAGPKELLLVPGADHSMNHRTPADGHFNEDPDLQWVKRVIAGYLTERFEAYERAGPTRRASF